MAKNKKKQNKKQQWAMACHLTGIFQRSVTVVMPFSEIMQGTPDGFLIHLI